MCSASKKPTSRATRPNEKGYGWTAVWRFTATGQWPGNSTVASSKPDLSEAQLLPAATAWRIACKQDHQSSQTIKTSKNTWHPKLDWAAAIVRTTNLMFSVISSYLRPSQLQDHAVTMQEIRMFILYTNIPFIITGHFNASPETLAEGGLLNGIRTHPHPQGRRWRTHNDVSPATVGIPNRLLLH